MIPFFLPHHSRKSQLWLVKASQRKTEKAEIKKWNNRKTETGKQRDKVIKRSRKTEAEQTKVILFIGMGELVLVAN